MGRSLKQMDLKTKDKEAPTMQLFRLMPVPLGIFAQLPMMEMVVKVIFQILHTGMPSIPAARY